MKKLISGVMALAMGLMLAAGSAWANSDRQFQTVTITSTNTLAITPPANVKYTLIDPTASDDAFINEVIPDEQTVTLTGNAFTQTQTDPMITVALLNDMGDSNMVLRLDSIRVESLTGNIDVLPIEDDLIDLTSNEDDPYATANEDFDAGDDGSKAGAIRGTHKLVVHKVDSVAPGVYDFVIVWTGWDA